jgi:hypothetical protein
LFIAHILANAASKILLFSVRPKIRDGDGDPFIPVFYSDQKFKDGGACRRPSKTRSAADGIDDMSWADNNRGHLRNQCSIIYPSSIDSFYQIYNSNGTLEICP